LSSVKTARQLILFILGLLAICYVGSPILYDLRTDDGLGCHIRKQNAYYLIYPAVQVFTFGVIAPCLILMFGILTIYNTKRVRVHRIRITQNRRTEYRLSFMLLVRVMLQLSSKNLHKIKFFI